MKLVGIYRQIAFAMMAMAFGITLFVVFTSYALYYFWQKYWPNYFPGDDSLPTTPEWVWLIMTTLAALALAIGVASRLSRQIIAPLTSVIDSIRQVALGDLSVRAIANENSPLETFQLVDDFNLLVEKLQRITDEQAFWNAAIAHELRTPVTILRGRLQGLAEGVFSPDERQFRSLLFQIESLNQLIEDLRVVSLAESGHLSLNIKKTDLTTDIRSLIDAMTDSLGKAGQHVLLNLEAGSIHCDPLRIRQALLAILENATKHANPGHITIQTKCEHDQYMLSVEDEGPGIPDSFAPHIFSAFRRAQEAKGNGSGLGLAVVAAIARAHGGKAVYQKTSNAGSRFIIQIPKNHSNA